MEKLIPIFHIIQHHQILSTKFVKFLQDHNIIGKYLLFGLADIMLPDLL